MSNAQGTGKSRRLDRDKEKREAAINSAIPSTPPQDEPPEKPAEPEPAKEPDSTPPPQDKAPDEAKPALEVDYKDAYRHSQEELRKERERNKTLQSKYNAEVPRLSKEVKDLKAKLEHGEGTPDVVSKVKESDEYKALAEEWDTETADRILGIAKHFAQNAMPAEPEPESAPEPSTPPPDNQFGINSYDEFVVSLDAQMPGWDLNYNNNPDFIKWAGENTEPLSGQSYLDLLNRAANETFDLNVARNIFSAFDRQVSQKSVDPVETYVEPTGGGSGSTQPEAPTFKEGDLEESAQLVRRGKKSREDHRKLQREYQQALKEGRVQRA